MRNRNKPSNDKRHVRMAKKYALVKAECGEGKNGAIWSVATQLILIAAKSLLDYYLK